MLVEILDTGRKLEEAHRSLLGASTSVPPETIIGRPMPNAAPRLDCAPHPLGGRLRVADRSTSKHAQAWKVRPLPRPESRDAPVPGGRRVRDPCTKATTVRLPGVMASADDLLDSMRPD